MPAPAVAVATWTSTPMPRATMTTTSELSDSLFPQRRWTTDLSLSLALRIFSLKATTTGALMSLSLARPHLSWRARNDPAYGRPLLCSRDAVNQTPLQSVVALMSTPDNETLTAVCTYNSCSTETWDYRGFLALQSQLQRHDHLVLFFPNERSQSTCTSGKTGARQLTT